MTESSQFNAGLVHNTLRTPAATVIGSGRADTTDFISCSIVNMAIIYLSATYSYLFRIRVMSKLTKKYLGKAHSKGRTFMDIKCLFPCGDSTTQWFESIFWPNRCKRLRCMDTNMYACTGNAMLYRCRLCWSALPIPQSILAEM